MYRFQRALKEACKFTIWITCLFAVMIGLAVGTVFVVDCLPLIETGKMILTSILWIIEIAFVVAFISAL